MYLLVFWFGLIDYCNHIACLKLPEQCHKTMSVTFRSTKLLIRAICYSKASWKKMKTIWHGLMFFISQYCSDTTNRGQMKTHPKMISPFFVLKDKPTQTKGGAHDIFGILYHHDFHRCLVVGLELSMHRTWCQKLIRAAWWMILWLCSCNVRCGPLWWLLKMRLKNEVTFLKQAGQHDSLSS